MLKNLNGWQRLWVVLTGLYLIPVVIFTVSAFPKASDYNYARVHDSIDLAGKYMDSSTPGYSYDGSYSVRQKYYSDLSDMQIIERLHTKFKDKVDFTKVEDEFNRKVDGLSLEQTKAIFYAVLWWLVPAGFLYLLGVSVGWIIRGFAVKNPNTSVKRDCGTSVVSSSSRFRAAAPYFQR